MDTRNLTRRTIIKGLATSALAAPAISLHSRTVNAASPIQMILNRYPASEYYANAMNQVPGVALNIQMMPADKAMDLLNINLSSKSSNIDILPANDTNIINFARNGWLMPLDDLWAKYKDEYDLAGVDANLLKGCSYDGRMYMIPNEFNTHLLFYRTDIYNEAGLQPAKTIEEFKKQAESLKTKDRAGTVLMMRVGDQCATTLTYYLNAVGNGWFDEKWQPTFASESGLKAIEFLKEMGNLAQRGYTSAAGDEGALALYQGFAPMGNMWATRVSSIEDPKKSRFVGKFGYAAPAQGGQRINTSGLAISAFTKQDPDALFRVMLETMKPDIMKGNLANNVPTRPGIMKDESVQKQYPYLGAAADAAAIGKFYPAMPYFYPVADLVTRRVLQVMTGEMPTKEAMEAAAAETKQLLTTNGFYKG